MVERKKRTTLVVDTTKKGDARTGEPQQKGLFGIIPSSPMFAGQRASQVPDVACGENETKAPVKPARGRVIPPAGPSRRFVPVRTGLNIDLSTLEAHVSARASGAKAPPLTPPAASPKRPPMLGSGATTGKLFKSTTRLIQIEEPVDCVSEREELSSCKFELHTCTVLLQKHGKDLPEYEQGMLQERVVSMAQVLHKLLVELVDNSNLTSSHDLLDKGRKMCTTLTESVSQCLPKVRGADGRRVIARLVSVAARVHSSLFVVQSLVGRVHRRSISAGSFPEVSLVSPPFGGTTPVGAYSARGGPWRVAHVFREVDKDPQKLGGESCAICEHCSKLVYEHHGHQEMCERFGCKCIALVEFVETCHDYIAKLKEQQGLAEQTLRMLGSDGPVSDSARFACRGRVVVLGISVDTVFELERCIFAAPSEATAGDDTGALVTSPRDLETRDFDEKVTVEWVIDIVRQLLYGKMSRVQWMMHVLRSEWPDAPALLKHYRDVTPPNHWMERYGQPICALAGSSWCCNLKRILTFIFKCGDDMKVMLEAIRSDMDKLNAQPKGLVRKGDLFKFSTICRNISMLGASPAEFDVEGTLGSGGQGSVYLVRLRKTRQQYALKKVSRASMLRDNRYEWSVREKNAMLAVNSDFVVRLHYFFEGVESVYFVMGYYAGGSVRQFMDYFVAQGCRLPLEVARFLLSEIVAAVADVHSCSCVHRDIKPSNIVLDLSGHLALTDFGSSVVVVEDGSEEQDETDTRPFFSPNYVAPEYHRTMVSGEPSDWWSVGIILVELIVGYPPFHGETADIVRLNVLAGDWSTARVEMKAALIEDGADNMALLDLADRLLALDPAERLGVNGSYQVKDHAAFRGVKWDHLRDEESPIKVKEGAIPIGPVGERVFEESFHEMALNFTDVHSRRDSAKLVNCSDDD